MKIAKSITDLIEKTPMLEISNFKKQNNLFGNIIIKLESFNPSSLVKDRIGLSMVEDALKKGLIKGNTTIIEPTSGNTGIALAFVCAAKGLKLHLTMPETMSVERRKIMQALGATLHLTEGAKGMKGAIQKANELKNEIENSLILSQFSNPANPQIHRLTTAKEILRDTNGKIDFFVSGVGTGGTITGVGEVLEKIVKNIKIIAVEPSESAVLSGESPGSHKIQGIGAGFVPEVLNTKIYDEVNKVNFDQAIWAARALAQSEGVLVGISSGAALYAAMQIAKKQENKNKIIVAIMPDTGERYLSTLLYDFENYPL